MVAESPDVVKRWTAAEVLQLVELGMLQDEHVELIEGELLVVPPQGPVHATLSVEIRRLLEAAYGEQFHTREHTSISATADSLPEPDVAVIRGEPREYLKRLPAGADIVLAVEVSHTSRTRDRRKASVYARAGIGTYWIVDVDARTVAVHKAPRDGEYTTIEILDENATLVLPAATATVTTRSLLP